MEKRNWNEVWTDNYTGKSEIARTINIKPNFKGNTYIPWATMERVLYQLDADAMCEPALNKEGGMVFTDVFQLPVMNKDGSVGSTWAVSHFVKVECVFMGKKFYENFPLQDTAYAAVRIFDQNIVNKAIQRAKAKVISRATGIGWGLYESGDLQYELDAKEEKPQPTPKPVATKQVEVNEEPKEVINYGQMVYDLLHGADPEKVEKVLAFVNKSLQRTYQKSLALEQEVPEINELMKAVAKPEVLIRSIKTQLEAE